MSALQESKGRIARAASVLGCSRPTLYTWIYQYGLERLAGVNVKQQDSLYSVKCKDTVDIETANTINQSVKSSGSGAATVPAVNSAAARVDYPITVTTKVRESLWKKARHEALERGESTASLVEKALEAYLTTPQKGNPE